ncbi:LOW QUALITY PROTEIN: PR domain zinc finger protein 8 [Macrobrachium rosenbergii]|uniref:LOW QUALITY PROTEIN: PR domain zinc finger protein 8 n=1 Tax=Macrobrachium rosenbergii TaxID=79674 RepID=UPI0034D6E5CB
MIMETLRGLNTSSSPHTSPTKRTFDVAFLTGARDSHALESSNDITSTTSPAKVSRIGTLKTSSSSSSSSSSSASSSSTLSSVSLSLTTSSPSPTRRNHSPSRDDVTPGSAFTKVTRTQGSSPPNFTSATSSSSTLDALSSTWPPVSASFSAVSTLLNSGKSLAPLLAAPGFIPPGLAPFLPQSAPDRLNNNLVEEYLKSQHQLLESKPSGDLSASEALSRLRSSMYPADPYKLPFSSLAYPLSNPPSTDTTKLASAAAAAAAAAATTPFLPQPSVSALMPPSFTTLALSTQNVCAKCNISFRMTSDLVYHMRSQHKREPDPYKKRRDEKLKCPICGETFRERHHLTRHMSAHQDRDEDESK